MKLNIIKPTVFTLVISCGQADAVDTAGDAIEAKVLGSLVFLYHAHIQRSLTAHCRETRFAIHERAHKRAREVGILVV